MAARDQTDKELQRDLATAWRIVAWLEKGGYELSARLFRHYLEASGEPVTIPLERLRGSNVFCDAERKIMERVAKQILLEAIDMLQCGDTFRQVTQIADDGDHRKTDDVAYESFETWKDLWTVRARDIDSYGALGKANIRVIPDFRIWRSGRELDIDGHVQLQARDTYDFDPHSEAWYGELRDLPSLLLGVVESGSFRPSILSLTRLQEIAHHGHAASFELRADWTKVVSALPPFTGLLTDIRSEVVRMLANFAACGIKEKGRLQIDTDKCFLWSEQAE